MATSKQNFSNDQILQIIEYYLVPHTLHDTAIYFNTYDHKVKKILINNNITFHAKETNKQLWAKKVESTCKSRYGVSYTTQTDEMKLASQQTKLDKYGDAFYNNRPQNIETCQARYGISNGGGSKEAKQKIKQAMLNKYGVENAFQAEECKEKSKQTCLEKYGVEYAACSKEIQTKAKLTNLERYGAENPFASAIIQAKIKQTNLERYGAEHYNETELAKQHLSIVNKSAEVRQKTKQTTFNHYGVDNYSKTTEFIEKNYTTKKKNHTFNSSKLEEFANQCLITKYGIDNVIRQYKDDRYPFACDFYIKSEDLFIELNLSWTHGGKQFKDTFEDQSKLAIWKEKAKASKYYQNAIETWTIRDVKKIQTAAKNNLNYILIYSIEELNCII